MMMILFCLCCCCSKLSSPLLVLVTLRWPRSLAGAREVGVLNFGTCVMMLENRTRSVICPGGIRVRQTTGLCPYVDMLV